MDGLEFPAGFLFGTSTSAYQIEGAWNEDGRGEDIWDRLTHDHPEDIKENANGHVACNSYHLYKEDVRMLKKLGVHFYRFSVSWSRILPTGHDNVVNQAGIAYYNNLINELIANGIQPMVTINHMDLPQPLQDLGGWTNPFLANYFEDYARVLYTNFGDRVKWWNTLNEPQYVAAGYNDGSFIIAPKIHTPGHGPYLAVHTMLLSHARAYRLYEREFKAKQGGKVSIVITAQWIEPKNDSKEEEETAERVRQMHYGWLLHPIYSATGDYPPVMKEWVAKKSKEEGYSRSRLPSFTKEEIEMVKGTWDFMGINHYTTLFIQPGEKESPLLLGTGVTSIPDDSYPSSAMGLQVVPWGFRKLLNWIAKEYNNPPVVITENGYADKEGLNDRERIDYVIKYLHELLNATKEDGCKVIGYSVWSVMDNFEWTSGYTMKFGLFQVDFNDPNRKRTAKKSAEIYSQIIKSNKIPAELLKVVDSQ